MRERGGVASGEIFKICARATGGEGNEGDGINSDHGTANGTRESWRILFGRRSSRGTRQRLESKFSRMSFNKRAAFGEARNAQEALDLVWEKRIGMLPSSISPLAGQKRGWMYWREIKKFENTQAAGAGAKHASGESICRVRVLKAGARSGYMTKESAPMELVGAVKKR